MEHESKEEVEIRGNTVWVVHRIGEMVRENYPGINNIHVSDHLWLATQEKHAAWRPYHLTRTTAY